MDKNTILCDNRFEGIILFEKKVWLSLPNVKGAIKTNWG